MKKIGTWIKENYLLIIAFIFFFVLIFLLTREGAAFYDKTIAGIKTILR